MLGCIELSHAADDVYRSILLDWMEPIFDSFIIAHVFTQVAWICAVAYRTKIVYVHKEIWGDLIFKYHTGGNTDETPRRKCDILKEKWQKEILISLNISLSLFFLFEIISWVVAKSADNWLLQKAITFRHHSELCQPQKFFLP